MTQIKLVTCWARQLGQASAGSRQVSASDVASLVILSPRGLGVSEG